MKKNKKTNEENSEKKPSAAELQQQLEQVTQEKDELYQKLMRISADYANHQKRTPKQIADSVAYEKKALMRSLLPSLDNFEHALASAETAKGEEALDGVLKGVKMVFEHMIDALKAHGVEQIQAVGKQFNPAFHEAVQMLSEPEKENNIVLEDFQKGYTLGGQTLRPSKVIVNKHPEETQAKPQVEEEVQHLDVKEGETEKD